MSSGHKTVAAIVASLLIAGLLAIGFWLRLDHFFENRAQQEVQLSAQRTVSLAETRIGWVTKTLDELQARDLANCRPGSLEALRLATFTTTPIKEISVVGEDGRTLCVDYGSPAEQRRVIGSAEPSGDLLIEIVEVGTRPGHMVRLRRPAVSGPTLAALVPPDLFIAQVSTQGGHLTSYARMTTANGILIGERGAAPRELDDQPASGQATLRSLLYGFVVAMSQPRVQTFPDPSVPWLSAAFMGGLATMFIAFVWLFKAQPRRELENPIAELERALKAGEFIPFYQPIVDIRSGRLRGAEVLMRWRKSDGTIISPATFIPLAESSGLIIEMTRVLMKRVRDEAGPLLAARPHLSMGFNLTARHFCNEDIVRDVRDIFGGSKMALRQVVLEVTERQPLENLTETRRVVAALQGLGVRVAIDDVGTGHSGLSYMLKLGVDIIKIDKMFIDALGSDRHSNTIVETLIDLAHNMRMEVIAEGVEQFEQVVHLRELGIRAAQGFVFSPPLPGSAFLQLVETIDPITGAGRRLAKGRVPPLRNLMPMGG